MANKQAEQLANAWQRYRYQADQPNWFTRWMLGRTLIVIEQTRLSDEHLASAAAALTVALETTPLAPPQPVDPRVDMLGVTLTAAQAHAVAALFASTEHLPNAGHLDGSQQRRKNPWGGFREAWLEHYNHLIVTEQGSTGMADTEVQSEVAGTVWKVLVKEGDAVTQDQELMILESMKMEIPVDAPCKGTVAKVLVAPEDGIEEDQVLLIIES